MYQSCVGQDSKASAGHYSPSEQGKLITHFVKEISSKWTTVLRVN